MKPPNYAVVIPTVGRDGVAALVRSAAGAPGPRRIVLADDRRSPGQQRWRWGDVAETAAGVPVTIVRTGGRGPAAARNAGWRAALAADPDLDWIAFVDDDVRLAEDWNAALVRDLADLPATVGASQAQLSVPAPPRRRPTDEERRTTGLVGARWITADMAYRVEVLATTGGFDERFPRAFREDADLALRSIRAGWSIVWGRRRTVHPLRARGGWWGSLAAQAGNADNALLRAKFGRRWRSLIHTDRGRTGRHGLAVAAAAGTVAGVLTRRPRWAAVAAAVWVGSTTAFALRRIRPGPRNPAEIATMILTSAVIPPLALGWRLRGELQVRRAGLRHTGGEPVAAVLFDRDGTLIHNVPYLADPAGVRPVAGARRALNRLRRRGIAVGVVSNQSGVARGLISPEALRRVNERVETLLGPFDTFQVCPHGPDEGCRCRKPEPGMVLAAAGELGLDPGQCLVVGDIGADVDAALAAGARATMVPTRETRIAEVDRAAVVATVAANLPRAVRLAPAVRR